MQFAPFRNGCTPATLREIVVTTNSGVRRVPCAPVSGGFGKGGQVVRSQQQANATGRLRRVAYSAGALAIIGGIVAVLGAPVKWL